MPSSRIFISCGQNADNGERQCATAIAKKLEELGFESYVAAEQTTLKGIKEAIFPQIRDFEYFLFVDFRREQFANSSEHRGSLITNQELALAAFLEKETLIFQEEGVRPFDGLLKFMQGKAHPFIDRQELPDEINRVITEEAQWNNNWRNALAFVDIDFDDPDFVTAGVRTGTGRYFHLQIGNNHQTLFANDCYAYLQSIKSVDTGAEKVCNQSELKWAGTMLPSVRIAPKSVRSLDAFYIDHADPRVVNFHTPWADSSKYRYSIQGPGDFVLTYAVSSSAFPTITKEFFLHINEDLKLTQLRTL